MKKTAHILFICATALALGSCDSTEPVAEPEPEVEERIVITLSERLVGLWQKEDVEDLDWLFKEGGSYLAGDLNPINPVVGLWELYGDTLHIKDNACVDAIARYKIDIDVNDMTVELLVDDCDMRRGVLAGPWRRFVYGQ